MQKLAVVMGHSSTVVTARYAHLRPDLFRDEDYQTLGADRGAFGSQVVINGESGPGVSTHNLV